MEFIPIKRVDGSTCAKLHIPELALPNKENLEHLLLFQVTTYVKLKNRGADGKADSWDSTFSAVNRFMFTLPEEHKICLAQTIILIHSELLEFFAKGELIHIHQLLRNISVRVDDLDKAIDLCDRLRAFVVSTMVVGLYEGAGKRAQDSAALTFLPDQVTELMAITLLCKMMCPLFGVLMVLLDKQIDNKLKEVHCVAIFRDLFVRKHGPLIEKLQNYIAHTVKKYLAETTSSMMHGYTLTTAGYFMYANLLIRQLVNVNLNVRDGNLMTYISVCIKRTVSTVQSAVLQKPTYSRKPMTPKHEDEGNKAQIELDSQVSRKTLSVGPLIKAALLKSIDLKRSIYSVNDELFDAARKFHLGYGVPIIPNPINKDINSVFYSRDFGGGRGILMLHGPEFATITSLLQVILLDMDPAYRPLMHMMTAVQADSRAASFTIDDGIFKLNAGASVAYRKCRQRFEDSPYGDKGKEWDNHIQTVTDHLITTGYIYNTATAIWNFLDEDNLNGKIIEPDEHVITGMCMFYDWMYELETFV